MATLNLGILVSGSGSNLQAICDAVAAGSLDARIRLVLSNKADAYGLQRAVAAEVPHQVISHRDFETREQFDDALVYALREAGVEWVVLAGFMRVLTPRFVGAFPGRILNIHPALLPAFPGTRAQRQALQYGVKVAGCTVHFIDEGVDTGPIIGQRAVPVLDSDDEASLSARILEQEHALLVDVLRWLAADRVQVHEGPEGGRSTVVLRPE